MTRKLGALVLVLLAGALLSTAIRRDRSPARDDHNEPIHRAAVMTEPALQGVDSLQVLPVAQPLARESRRNLFVFDEVPEVTRQRIVPMTSPKPTEETQVAEHNKPEPELQHEPEFPMRYIGTFGLARDPIAVFAANGEIVNAKIGDVLGGGFRLAAIGLESVDVSTPQGRTQRVAMESRK